MLNQARIDDLNAKLAARTDSEGKALPGYGRNVIAIKAELERLQKDSTDGK